MNTFMKFLQLFTISLLVSILPVAAQNFKSGLMAGMVTSQVSGDQLGGFHKAGIVAGPFVTIKIGDSSAVELELLYAQKGSLQAQDLEKGKAYFQLKVNYAEFPLLYKYKIRRFTYELGASLGYLINSKVSDVYGEFPAGTVESRPFKKTEWSACAGINYRIFNHFSVNWRFTNSVFPIRDHASGKTYRWNKGQYNTAMYFALRYDFK